MSIIANIAANNQLILTSPNGTQFTNNTNIPKELAIFAIYHAAQYDGKPTTTTNLSVSDFLTPMRKLIYKIHNPAINELTDVSYIMKSAKGTAMHSGMEAALEWYGGYKQEIRSQKIIDGVVVSGKFDLIDLETNTLKDLKHVSSYAYKKLMLDIEKIKDMDNSLTIKERLEYIPTYTKFQLQMSMYKWLNPELKLSPYGDIIFSLNDGGGMERYPIDNFHRFPLLLDEEIEEFVINHLTELKQHLADGTMPLCSDAERGYSPAEYKLQRVSPTNGKLSTVRGSKFNNYTKFREFVIKSGKLGDVEQIQDAKYTLCNYCNYSSICTQE
jgi:hypothetical protein